MPYNQHYLSHDTFENFENDFTPEYTGKYDIPIMPEPCELEIEPTDRFVRFCDWRQVKDPENCIAHFYYDDYKFIQAWRTPERYLERLSRFKAVVTPDFSPYTDMPKVLRLLAHYRSRWLGAYWQYNNIEVIPDVLFGREETYDYCFDGIPYRSVVAVSTVGIKRSPYWNGKKDDLFKRGWEEMIKRINPTKVLLHGPIVDGIETDRIIKLQTFYDERRPYLDKLKEAKRKNGKGLQQKKETNNTETTQETKCCEIP